MTEKRQGHVESVKKIVDIDAHFTQFLIQIDFDEYYIWYDAAELASFVNKDVMYRTRPDIVNGKRAEVVCEIALVTEVVTIDRTKNDIKLIPLNTKRPVCNFSKRDIKMGEVRYGAIAILVDVTMGQSKKASWLDCDMLDCNGEVFSVKIFQSNADIQNVEQYETMKNGYVQMDIENSRYGFNTAEMTALPQDIELSPEVVVAKKVVTDYISTDPLISEIVNHNNLMYALDKHIDYEPGYMWVRMAAEMYLVDAADSITDDIDIKSFKRAIICNRLYLTAKTNNWAPNVVNIIKIAKYKELADDMYFRSIVDTEVEVENTMARDIYKKIVDMVEYTIKLRRGLL